MSAGLTLGPFPVRGTAAQADAFREATGLPEGGETLPLTFPMRWMVTPDILAALRTVAAAPALVLVHESQSFEGSRPLQVDEAYQITLMARRETAPDRLCVDGMITDPEGTERARVETVLRLVAAP